MLSERVKDFRFPGRLLPICYQILKISLTSLTFILLLLAIDCSRTSKTGIGKEPMVGTWANKEYFSGYWVWRFVYQPNGQIMTWEKGKPSDQANNYEGRFAIEKKWVDSEGNIWYRSAEKVCIAPYSEAKAIREYGLIKVHVAGNVLEGEWSTVDFPPEFGALGNKHFIYYREQ